MKFIDDVETGMVHVNEPTVGGEAQLPFGGTKSTGVGEREMAEGNFSRSSRRSSSTTRARPSVDDG